MRNTSAVQDSLFADDQLAATPPVQALEPPLLRLAALLAEMLRRGEAVGSNLVLFRLAFEIYGGTRASGAYTSRDAYDAMETAVNRLILERGRDLLAADHASALTELSELSGRLPTQNARTDEQQLLQQFSTPPEIAWLVAIALRLTPSDTVLEPSAGTGSLASWATAAGATVLTNELSERRRQLLAWLGYSPVAHDAELIDDLLDAGVRPTAVAMNPPFSSTAGRTATNRTIYGARHIEQALRRLAPGGRLVTVIGEGVGRFGPAVRTWWRSVAARFTVTANLALPRAAYAKYGTSYPVHLVVIDRVRPSDEARKGAFRWRTVASLMEAAMVLADLPARASLEIAETPKPAPVPRPRLVTQAPLPIPPVVPAQQAPVADVAADDEPESGPYVRYVARSLAGAHRHPARLVETASMAAVDPPEMSYIPALPSEIITEGRISDVQLERVIAAGSRHSQRLGDGSVAGYFLGDGTGVGKGRSLAAIILDNHMQGRRRALWLSVSRTLRDAAAADLAALGADIEIASVSDFAADSAVPEFDGVLFSTYQTMIAKSKSGRARLDQITSWLGCEPVIVIDECHKGKNAVPAGTGEPTQTGRALIDMQERIPAARIVYSSATGATEIRNMAYASRLGLWGEGTSFPAGFGEFLAELATGGVAAMEMLSRDLKALGIYHSASISFAGVRYREAIHRLTDAQRETYDTAARAWQLVLRHFDEALEITTASRQVAAAARRRFWGDHQRFFKSVITSMKIPTAIAQIERSLSEGKSVVASLIATAESRTKELVARALVEGTDLDALNFAADEIIKNLVVKAYPVVMHQEITHDDGSTTREPVLDESGDPVLSAEALRRRDGLLDELDRLVLPENPLDQIVNHFGPSNVAEMTGRAKRIVRGPDGAAEYRKRLAGVAANRINAHEMEAFQAGRKRIAIISAAASTGISLHASCEAANTQRRVHLTLELGWSADAQIQTFGRTHRANQAAPPEYCLVSTELGGERRFSSTIARRLESLGAITKGQRDAAGAETIAEYNVETEYGEAALATLYAQMKRGVDIPGLGGNAAALRDMGLITEANAALGLLDVSDDDRMNVPRFLNRVLALECDRQNAMFDRFFAIFEDLVAQARENGTYDLGVTDLRGLSVTVKGEPELVRTCKVTGARTVHHEIAVKVATEPLSWEDVERKRSVVDIDKFGAAGGYYESNREMGIFYAQPWTHATDKRTGAVSLVYRVVRPSGHMDQRLSAVDLATRYREIDPVAAESLWSAAVAADPGYRVRTHHIIAGTVLPIWRKLSAGSEFVPRIVRVETDCGRRVVGVEISRKRIATVLAALGVTRAAWTPEVIFDEALEEGVETKLGEGLRIRRTRLPEGLAVEIAGARPEHYPELRRMGCRTERINWVQRFFVPSDEDDAVTVIRRLVERFTVAV